MLEKIRTSLRRSKLDCQLVKVGVEFDNMVRVEFDNMVLTIKAMQSLFSSILIS